MSARGWSCLFALLAMFVLLLAGCGDSDDGASDSKADVSPAETVDEDEQADEDEGDPTPMPHPVSPGDQPPIVIVSPTPFQQLVGSFVLSGSAQVHEGTIQWAILDAKLKPMVGGTTTATCGSPCRGKFRVTVSLAKVPFGSWELHAWSPNVADDGPDRLHDTMVPITVAAKRTPGAPDPGALPPGGAPQG